MELYVDLGESLSQLSLLCFSSSDLSQTYSPCSYCFNKVLGRPHKNFPSLSHVLNRFVLKTSLSLNYSFSVLTCVWNLEITLGFSINVFCFPDGLLALDTGGDFIIIIALSIAFQ